MIVITSMALGATAGLGRSALAMAVVAMLIGTVFALAALLSAGPVAITALLLAIAGYNLGLLNLIFVALAIDLMRAA